jgi:hypothetical protein
VAKGLLAGLPDTEGRRPAVVEALPTEGLVATSVSFFHHHELALPDRLPRELSGPEGLAIGAETPAAFAAYAGEGDEPGCHVVIVHYPDEAAAEAALARCRALRKGTEAGGEGETTIYKTDDGFESFVRRGPRVAAVVSATTAERARLAASRLALSIER